MLHISGGRIVIIDVIVDICDAARISVCLLQYKRRLLLYYGVLLVVVMGIDGILAEGVALASECVITIA